MILYQSSTPNFTRSKNREHTSAKKTVDRNDFSKNSETANTTNVTATLAIGLGTEFYKKTEHKNTLN
jgi:hypothetical protein